MDSMDLRKPKPLSPPNCKECRYYPYNKSLGDRFDDGFYIVLMGIVIVLMIPLAAAICIPAGKGLWKVLTG